jgi:hypothetical protein
MKNIKFIQLLGLCFLTLACSEDDKLTEVVRETTTTRGAILRTLSNDPNSFDLLNPDSEWTVSLEEQDQEGGALLADVDVFVNFVDNTSFNGTTAATSTLLETIPGSAFTVGPDGLPRTTYSVVYGDALNALGITNNQSNVFGGDQIQIKFVLNLTDGRSFTDTDTAPNIATGSFFRSQYLYTANIVCSPSTPTPGTWSIEMQDSYGDGWNGASLEVTIDGTTTSYTIPDGSAASFTFEVPTGASAISIIYTAGAFDEENTFQVTSANSNVVLDLGPSPAPGAELLDYCQDNL